MIVFAQDTSEEKKIYSLIDSTAEATNRTDYTKSRTFANLSCVHFLPFIWYVKQPNLQNSPLLTQFKNCFDLRMAILSCVNTIY